MRSTRSSLLLAMGVVLMVACSSKANNVTNVSKVTVDDLTGTWDASSNVFTNAANSSQTFDLIANGGETRMTVLAGGKARTWVTIGTFADEWDSQLSISGTTLTAVPAETTRPTLHFNFTLVGGVLTLTTSDATFDFTLSGGAGVPAKDVVTLVKQ